VTPIPEAEAVRTRTLELYKVPDSCTGQRWSINGLRFDDITEFPVIGTTEIWSWVNRSGFIHPMHMHLVKFQVLDRQPFVLVDGNVQTTGPRVKPDSSEAGWKDTAPARPLEILRVIARFEDYTGRYLYHCHILEHEEHEMMRQFEVVASTAVASGTTTHGLSLAQNVPNPTTGMTRIAFALPSGATVKLVVVDVTGRKVATLVSQWLAAGEHEVIWNGRSTAAPGVYFYHMVVNGQPSAARRLVVQ
jgi:hypothetical protein